MVRLSLRGDAYAERMTTLVRFPDGSMTKRVGPHAPDARQDCSLAKWTAAVLLPM